MTTNNFQDQAMRLIAGSYDMHVHTGPSHFPRGIDDFQAAKDAQQYNMAGVLIKSHYEPTGARAQLANKYAGCSTTKLFGGLALNWPCGGLNPYAVESAIRTGAKMIWMPTRDSKHSLTFGDMPGDFFTRDGLSILDKNSKLIKPVLDILEILKKHEIPIATGHLSIKESQMLCNQACEMKVKAVLTHPDWYRTIVPVEIQVQLAEKGVFIEKLSANIREQTITAPAMADAIRKIGAHHILFGTDMGLTGLPMPCPEFFGFIQSMLEQNISMQDMRIMLTTVPESLLNI